MHAILLLAVVILLAGLLLKQLRGMRKPQSRLNALIAEARAMESQSVIMPARIFDLAHRISDEGDPLAAQNAARALVRSPGRFTRRVGYTVLRTADEWMLENDDPADLVRTGLDDRTPWVVHDAIWLAERWLVDDPNLQNRIAAIAARPLTSETASDADASLIKRARAYRRAIGVPVPG